MDKESREKVAASLSESADLDFKASFDVTSAQDWCEFIKDFVAMANSGGGIVIFGVNDDGSPSESNLDGLAALDPAVMVDKIKKYTGQHITGFVIRRVERNGTPVVAVKVSGSRIPIVFTAPGTYDVGGGKQKSAFGLGTVYFRHGAKSEPGTSEDLRAAQERELDRIRSSWMEGIAKVVTAPVGAAIQVLPGEVNLSGAEDAVPFRLVDDESAPAFRAVRTDKLYPYRQKELVARVNALLGERKVTAHDVLCVRKVHEIESNQTFFYKPQFSSPQYSEAFAEWLIEQYRSDANFFNAAREAVRPH